VIETTRLPDRREAEIRVGVPDDSYLGKEQLDSVAFELRVDGAVVASRMTLLDADQEEEARELAHQVAEAPRSGELEPRADAIDPRRRAPLPRAREHDEHAQRVVGAEAVVGAGGDEDGVALDKRRLLALDLEDARSLEHDVDLVFVVWLLAVRLGRDQDVDASTSNEPTRRR
jgi:hypothetical protein